MKRILVAVDKTKNAELLVGRAVSIASATGAKVGLCHIVAAPLPIPLAPGGFVQPPSAAPHLVKEARLLLRRLQDLLPASVGGEAFLELGTPAAGVCDVARTFDADMLVIGAHEHGLAARVLGTTASRIVNHIDRPVLIVRPRPNLQGAQEPRTARAPHVLAALDDSPTATLVRDTAANVARWLGAKLRLVRAVASREEAHAADMELARHENGLPPDVRDGRVVCVGPSAAEVICDEAHAAEAELVVIGAHDYGLFERILGTTASRVVDHIDCPVLVVRHVEHVTNERPGPASDMGRLAAQLRSDHARLELEYDALLDAYASQEWESVRRSYATFEARLREHMDIEERDLFPTFRRIAAAETDALVAEHDELRRLLDTFGIGVELHAVPRRDVDALLLHVRAHSTREESLLYPWMAQAEAVPQIAEAPAAGS